MRHTRLTVVGVSLVASLVALLASASLAYSSGELKPLLTVFFNCGTSTPCLSSQNSSTGVAIQGLSRQGYIGVYGYSDNAIGSSFSGQYGAVRGFTNGLNGAAIFGYARRYGLWGVQYDTALAGNGVFGRCYGSNCDAIFAYTSAGGAAWALRGYSQNSYALFADSGNASTYDAFFPTRIRAGATTIQSTGMAMDAVNNGGEAVGPGDVVVFNGFVDTAAGRILAVKKANGAADTAVVGVVQSALVLEEAATNADVAAKHQAPAVEQALEGEEAIASAGVEAAAAAASTPIQTARFVEGAAAPGQNLTVLIQGIVRVKVDASGVSIRAGDALIASGTAGFAVSAVSFNAGSRADENAGAREGESESGDASARVSPGAAVGRALESLEGGTGEIYVLVGAR